MFGKVKNHIEEILGNMRLLQDSVSSILKNQRSLIDSVKNLNKKEGYFFISITACLKDSRPNAIKNDNLCMVTRKHPFEMLDQIQNDKRYNGQAVINFYDRISKQEYELFQKCRGVEKL